MDLGHRRIDVAYPCNSTKVADANLQRDSNGPLCLFSNILGWPTQRERTRRENPSIIVIRRDAKIESVVLRL